MRHVFQRPESLASVSDLIDAKEEEDNMISEMFKNFMSGKKKIHGF